MTFAIKGGGVLRAPNPAENCDYFLILISAALSLSLSLSFLLSVSLIISIIYHALFITLKLILNITLTINHISISISFVISININIYISIRTCTTTRTCKTNVRKPNMKGHFKNVWCAKKVRKPPFCICQHSIYYEYQMSGERL